MNDWNIQSRAQACQSCEEPFADKQPYHTLLSDENGEMVRFDLCAPCWASKQGDTSAHGKFISYWQGVYEAPPAAPPDPIRKETAETLLRKLIESNDASHGAACYILAVMLERKRILKVKEQLRAEGRRIFIYEQPRTGDVFTVADPDLQLNQLEEVQRDVAQLLEHGLDPPPAPDEPQAAAAGEPEIVGPVDDPVAFRQT